MSGVGDVMVSGWLDVKQLQPIGHNVKQCLSSKNREI